MKYLVILLLILFALFQMDFFSSSVTYGPGVLAPDDPIQLNLKSAPAFEFKDYTITPLADFTITARVLSRENYRIGNGADLSPVDLALGWGAMSDETVLEKIDITQSGRWYHWYTKKFPIPRREIETHSANMHMIPADPGVEYAIDKTVKGNVIELHGKLVSIARKDGWHWKSSMTRDDTGDGACEVIYVESFEIKQ